MGKLLDRIDEKLSKSLIVLIPISFVAGYFLKPWGPRFKDSAYLMLFSIMFASSYGLRFKSLLKVKDNRGIIIIGLFTQFIILPIISVAIVKIFYSGNNLNYSYGHYCLALAPSAISTIIWSRISKGNLPLATVLVSTQALLTPYVTPLILKAITGKMIAFNAIKILLDLVITVFTPTILAMATYSKKLEERTKRLFGIWSKLGMLYMITLNTSIAFNKILISSSLVEIFLFTGLQVSLSYLTGLLIGKILHLDTESKITVTYYMGMKNNGAGFIVVLAGFPYESLFPLASAMMWQQPIASVINLIWGKILANNGSYRSRVRTIDK